MLGQFHQPVLEFYNLLTSVLGLNILIDGRYRRRQGLRTASRDGRWNRSSPGVVVVLGADIAHLSGGCRHCRGDGVERSASIVVFGRDGSDGSCTDDASIASIFDGSLFAEHFDLGDVGLLQADDLHLHIE